MLDAIGQIFIWIGLVLGCGLLFITFIITVSIITFAIKAFIETFTKNKGEEKND